MSETFSLWNAGAGSGDVSRPVTDLTPRARTRTSMQLNAAWQAGFWRLKRRTLDQFDGRNKVVGRSPGEQPRH